MAKRLSEKEKEEMIKRFSQGETLEELSKNYQCTKLTISRNLKKNLGEEEYKLFMHKNSSNKKLIKKDKPINSSDFNDFEKISLSEDEISDKQYKNQDTYGSAQFVEITPLDQEIDQITQKDLSSVPISEIELPKVVYMVVDNKIELPTKQLKDFPEWQFLPLDDLERKTIVIYFDLKIAKRSCNKEHKVIKVPNTNVFKIVAPILISRGISRIVTEEKLISL